MQIRKMIRRISMAIVVALTFTVANSANAQVVANFGFHAFGPRYVVAAPIYPVRPYRIRRPIVRFEEIWTVTMRSRNGNFSRWYRVDNSAQAIGLARREFPNAWIVGASRSFR